MPPQSFGCNPADGGGNPKDHRTEKGMRNRGRQQLGIGRRPAAVASVSNPRGKSQISGYFNLPWDAMGNS